MLARPHAGSTDNVGAMTQPLIFAHNSNQILGLSPDGSVRINKQYKLPKTDGQLGQVLTSNGSGNTSWETPDSDSVPTNGIIFSAVIDPSIEAAGYSYYGSSRQQNFEGITYQDTANFNFADDQRNFRSFKWGGDKCFVFGGSEIVNNTTVYSNKGEIFDATTESITTMTSVNAPSPRQLPRMFWTGSKLIVIGGSTNTTIGTGGIYDPATDSWTTMSNPNTSDNVFLNMLINNTKDKLILFRGWDNTGVIKSGRVYDIASNTWTTMSDTGYPSWREGMAIIMIDDKLIIYEGTDEVTGQKLNDGSVYDPANNS